MRFWFLAGIGALAAFVRPGLSQAQSRDSVWVWNPRCANPTMIEFRLQFDRAVVYRTLIPICRMPRDSEDGHLDIPFTPQRAIVWYGYRSDEDSLGHDRGDTTAANTKFTIGIWQAGGEPDLIELGFSALANDGDHMNSIHLLWPRRTERSEMAPGLVVETRPAPRNARAQH